MFFFFFFNDTATTEIYTLSLHDALPICIFVGNGQFVHAPSSGGTVQRVRMDNTDRKSTRLNSSHQIISYAVFCLKKKTTAPRPHHPTTSAWASTVQPRVPAAAEDTPPIL